MCIDFGSFPIYTVFFVSAIILNCIIIFKLGKIQEIEKNTLICSLTLEMLGVISGMKILFMIQTPNNSGFYNAGFSANGGFIGAILAIIVFSLLYKIPIKKLLNIYIPIFPLMYAISKLGCFCAGCCYGIEYSGFGNVVYRSSTDAPLNVSLFPIQFIEFLVNILVFIFIMIKYSKNKDSIKLVSYVFLLCGFFKFVLEFLRFSWNGIISSTQWISLFITALGIICYYIWRKYEKH